jgi:hypothetical protein
MGFNLTIYKNSISDCERAFFDFSLLDNSCDFPEVLKPPVNPVENINGEDASNLLGRHRCQVVQGTKDNCTA